jgi:glycogen debranching enzyme
MRKEKELLQQAWRHLEKSVVYYTGQPVGTVAALKPGTTVLNYDQIFTRDFFVSGLAFLLNGKSDIVRNFLAATADLQSIDKSMDCFTAGEGLMPASFKIAGTGKEEKLVADFGEHSIGRVTPVDSSLWWLLLLRVYVKASGDETFVTQKKIQETIVSILDLYLVNHFELVPTLLVPDGAFMIDRRMGMYGHPLDIEVLFYAALRAACEMLSLLPSKESNDYIVKVEHRIGHLIRHIHTNYWLDKKRIDSICSFNQEEFGVDIVNKYNIYPASVPQWVWPWTGENGGYFAGNIGPGRMDFRFLALGNILSIITSLADHRQQLKILALLDARQDMIVAEMPMKACYPALEDQDWHILTGADQKNMPWSYHNGGSWPFLLWALAALSVKTDKPLLTMEKLVHTAAVLEAHDWPEYFDGKKGDRVGSQARRFQVWSIAGFITAHTLLKDPQKVSLLSFESPVLPAECPMEVK